MPRRSTIGANPLDAVLPPPSSSQIAAEEDTSPEIPAPEEPRRVRKERLTVHLPVELIERVKNAVYWTPGLTLAALAEEGLRTLVAQMEDERKAPFPQREAELKGGRPLK